MGCSLKDLAAINQCQLSHQILFLSDLMDGWGHSLSDSLLHPPSSPPLSSWQWPRSHASSVDWQIWSQYICRVVPTMALGDWLYLPHLSVFLPFDLSTWLLFYSLVVCGLVITHFIHILLNNKSLYCLTLWLCDFLLLPPLLGSIDYLVILFFCLGIGRSLLYHLLIPLPLTQFI